MSFSITGNIVDVWQQKIYRGTIVVENDRILSIQEINAAPGEDGNFILPGFIDAHVHIESSMLVPSEFARLAVVHGTVAAVSDPHEIANVCGRQGVQYMIDNGNTTPFKFYFGAPSCVPATDFETAGAAIISEDIEQMMQREEIYYLSEVMNFPGVLNNDSEVMKKIAAAKRFNKPVDGHAPGLRGDTAKTYCSAGISTDHECVTKEEALEKLGYGMNILIREGSAAKNFEALIDLLNEYPGQIMFCTDDMHPDNLVKGHINILCARAVAKGIDVFNVVKAACVNPVTHYKLKTGLLRQNDFADFIVVKDLKNFEVLQTYINGSLVADGGKTKIESQKAKSINNFACSKKEVADFIVPVETFASGNSIVIEALDGQLITNKRTQPPKVVEGNIVSDTENDILKIVVVNRYKDASVAKAFIKNFGLKSGAIASSVAHDSHNIIAVGADDESICKAVNSIIENKGGICCVGNASISLLSLPIAGLMSTEDGYEVAQQYTALDAAVKKLGSALRAPFMTLSFMALLVIPHLKLSDLGLFDGDEFKLV